MRVYARFDLLGSPLLALWAAGLLVAEALRPRRTQQAPRLRRYRTHAALGTVAAVVERAAVVPALMAAAHIGERKKWGLLRRLPPGAARNLLGVLALDLGMYAWHRMNHRVGVLWRFHGVHHADLALDITTAPRLHPGELLGSIPVRCAQLLVIGASPRLVLGYELLIQAAALFHHSNLALGDRASSVFMTPLLHTRHHAAVEEQRNVNWGIVLSLWDKLFGSFDPRPARDPRLGIEQVRASLTAPALWLLPFRSRITSRVPTMLE
jgi:sterol desaturase/sphingolipid hydroxylase (fatty acid hydroxylase superfamily)